MVTKADNVQFEVNPGGALKGPIEVPGDKSISHRSVMFGAMANGETRVRGWLAAGDTEATLGAVQTLGVPVVRQDRHTLKITGGQMSAPPRPLNFVNAGTGIRLIPSSQPPRTP